MDSIDQYEALLKNWGYGKEWGYKDTSAAKKQRKEATKKVFKAVKIVVKAVFVKSVSLFSQVKVSASKAHA